MAQEILSIGDLLGVGGGADPSALSAYIPFSGLNYSGDKITGISGSAIAGGVESSVVSSIVSSMVSGKVDQSAFDDCCSSVQSALSSKMDASASGDFYPNDNPSGFITGVDLSPYQEKSGMSAYLPASSSGEFAPSGDYAYNSGLSAKLDASASSMFQPSGNYAPSGDYAFNSSVSSKLDASASGQFYPMTGNPSGFLTGVDLSPYQEKSGMSAFIPTSASGEFAPSGDYAYNSSLSSKMDASATADFYPTGNPSGFVRSADLSSKPLVPGDHIKLTDKGTSVEVAFSGELQPTADYAYQSSLSSYQEKSAMSAYQPTSAMTAYQPSGNYATPSDLSGKMDSSALASAEIVGGASGYSSISGMGFIAQSAKSAGSASHANTADSAGSAVYDSQGNPIHTFYIPTSESASYAKTEDLADYQQTATMSAYQKASAMSGYATTADLASGLSGKMDTTAGLIVSSTGSALWGYTRVMTNINGLMVSARLAGYCQNCESASAAGSAASASQAQVAVGLSGVAKSSIVQYSAISGEDSAITSIGGSAIGGGGGGGTEWVSGQFGDYNYVSSNLGVIGGKSGLMSATSEVFNPDATATATASASANGNAVSWTGQTGGLKLFSANTEMSASAEASQDFVVSAVVNGSDLPTAIKVGNATLSASASSQQQGTWWNCIQFSGRSSCAPSALSAAQVQILFGQYAYTGNLQQVYGSAKLTNKGAMETATSYMTADILATIMGG